MVNVALAFAFLSAMLFSPGGRVLRATLGQPLLQGLPPYQAHLLLAFANYLIPAVVFYGLLRLLHGETWLRHTNRTSRLLGTANVLFVLYVAARTFASTIEGGGASFAVTAYGVFLVWPALLMLIVGLGSLAYRSIQQRADPREVASRPFGIGEGLILIIAVAVPGSVAVSTLYLAEDAPIRLAREADAVFQSLCQSAGEKIAVTPQSVDGVYLAPNSERYFDRIVKGTYAGHGSGQVGNPLVFTGFLRYFEEIDDRQSVPGAARYLKHGLSDWKGVPEDALTSNYGVFQEKIDIGNHGGSGVKALGIEGTQVVVKDLRTGQITATLTYFTNARLRKICGHSDADSFSVRDFIKRSLNLTPRFPNGAIQAPTETAKG